MGDKAKDHERLSAALRGAFSGSPTPLKAIPKKNGESRSTTDSGSSKKKTNKNKTS